HVIETITDVTEQKRIEEAARKTEKMEALSRLAGGMAHDINNLLTVVMGASEHVASLSEDGASRLIQTQRLRNAVGRAAELTRRLVAFSHHQVLQQSLLDLNGIIKDLEPRVRMLAGDGIFVETNLCDEPMCILADRQQLEQ